MAETTGLQLPTLTLCNRGFFSMAKVTELGMDSKTATFLVGMISPGLVRFANLNSPKVQKLAEHAVRQVSAILNERNFTIPQLIQAMSYSCEELLLKCSFGLQSYESSECCQRVTPIATTSGLCFSWITSDQERQTMMGEYHGITLYIRMPQNDFVELYPQLVDVSRMVKSEMQVTVTSNLTYPSLLVTGRGTLLTENAVTSIPVLLTKVNKEGLKTFIDMYTQPCLKPSDASLQFFSDSFLSTSCNCMDGAITKCIFKLCDCYFYGIMYTMQDLPAVQQNGQTSFCHSKYTEYYFARLASTCLIEELSRCKDVCEELTYSYTSTVSTLRPAFLQDLYHDLQLNRRNSSVALVTVFFPSYTYNAVKLYKDSMLHLISDVGGYMGLFLGCSLITVIEFLLFTFCLVYHLLIRLKNLLLPSLNHSVVTPVTLK